MLAPVDLLVDRQRGRSNAARAPARSPSACSTPPRLFTLLEAPPSRRLVGPSLAPSVIRSISPLRPLPRLFSAILMTDKFFVIAHKDHDRVSLSSLRYQLKGRNSGPTT